MIVSAGEDRLRDRQVEERRAQPLLRIVLVGAME
jgi:hypothetical protein